MALDKGLKERLSKIDQIREELKKAEKTASTDIINILKELMASNPLLAGIRWNQYTPHFNDGDVCEFGVNGPEFKFNLGTPSQIDDEDQEYNDEGWFDEYDVDDKFFEKRTDLINAKQIPKLKKTVKEAKAVFEKLCTMDTQLQSMFGDGVEVTVTAEGVETEDYDHD